MIYDDTLKTHIHKHKSLLVIKNQLKEGKKYLPYGSNDLNYIFLIIF